MMPEPGSQPSALLNLWLIEFNRFRVLRALVLLVSLLSFVRFPSAEEISNRMQATE